MNKRVAKAVLGLSLLLTGLPALAAPAQVGAAGTCCIGSEWVMPTATVSPQSSGDFCCIAIEWQADPTATPSSVIESAVQSDRGSCCIASEWDAS